MIQRHSRSILSATALVVLVSSPVAMAESPQAASTGAPSAAPPNGPAPAPAASNPASEAPAVPPASPAEEKPSEPPPVYVEHLGPDSYPGKLRGLYGGSLWLEPSFHGLQWPIMAKSGVGVSGSFWVDTGYEKITRGLPDFGDTTMWLQQGRGVLRVTPTYTDGNFFIQAQVELVGNQCQQAGGGTSSCQTFGTFDTDDLWIRFGHWNLWDIKAGRYEAWELYHTGMGLDINTMERQGATRGNVVKGSIDSSPAFYGVNFLHDRPSAGLGVGYASLHAYPTDFLRFELLGELGTDDSTGNGYLYRGGRPSAIVDLGKFKLKAGAEYEKRTKSTQYFDGTKGEKRDYPYSRVKKGVGGSFQVVLDPWIEFGANAAWGKQSETDLNGNPQGKSTYTTSSIGAFANARPAKLWLVGAGANWTILTDSFYANGSSDPNRTAHLQAFAAVQYLLKGQLFIKGVLGYSRADYVDSDTNVDVFSNYMYSFRVRLMYLY